MHTVFSISSAAVNKVQCLHIGLLVQGYPVTYSHQYIARASGSRLVMRQPAQACAAERL